jgi:type VI secretion system FHA domain protein
MNLTLKVLSFKNQPVTEIRPVFIDNTGGSIGRSDDNTLVLPDAEKFVSRHHAVISFKNGCYYLTDNSLGGIYINSQEAPLKNATERLDNGMILRVGEYELAVAISDEHETEGFPFCTEKPTRKDFLFAGGAQEASDFPFANEVEIAAPQVVFPVDEPFCVSENTGVNLLMADGSIPSHEELVQTNVNEQVVKFESGLRVNHSPLIDSYISPVTTETPKEFSFEDEFSGTAGETKSPALPVQPNGEPVVDDFEALFGVKISNKAAEFAPVSANSEINTPSINDNYEIGELITEVDCNKLAIEQTDSFQKPVTAPKLVVTDIEIDNNEANSKSANVLATKTVFEKTPSAPADSAFFNAFLQGVAVECDEIDEGQQTETLHRVGQMFRKLIDGTVAVLRSRAEFKSLCRVNMTVIRASNNNPLKFTVSTDDVLRQLIENKTDGFLSSTSAIEESFDDIMNHQLAMQAGIQASLTDLLKSFDPKAIERQFEQGIVLQKKAKCWDRYEETYRNTVEDAVENFFGEAFVKAYEKQMSLLTNSRRK